jgi:hypothetical protein
MFMFANSGLFNGLALVFPSFVKTAKYAPHPLQLVQFSHRVGRAGPRANMVHGVPNQFHPRQRNAKGGKKACGSIAIGETPNVVHVGIDLIGLVR